MQREELSSVEQVAMMNRLIAAAASRGGGRAGGRAALLQLDERVPPFHEEFAKAGRWGPHGGARGADGTPSRGCGRALERRMPAARGAQGTGERSRALCTCAWPRNARAPAGLLRHRPSLLPRRTNTTRQVAAAAGPHPGCAQAVGGLRERARHANPHAGPDRGFKAPPGPGVAAAARQQRPRALAEAHGGRVGRCQVGVRVGWAAAPGQSPLLAERRAGH